MLLPVYEKKNTELSVKYLEIVYFVPTNENPDFAIIQQNIYY